MRNMKEVKISRTHRLDPSLDRQVSNLANQQNQTRSQVVRQALSDYVQKNKK